MKFYPIMMSVMFFIMYATLIFAAESPDSTKLPFFEDLTTLVGEFSKNLYKKTIHIKYYSSFLQKTLSYHVECKENDNCFEIAELSTASRVFYEYISGSFAFLQIAYKGYTLLNKINNIYEAKWDAYKAKWDPYEAKRIFYTDHHELEFPIDFGKIIAKTLLFLIATDLILNFISRSGQIEKIINILFRNYTYIKYPPLQILILNEKNEFCVTGSEAVSNVPAVIQGYNHYYRTEYRSLSNMKFKRKGLKKILPAEMLTIQRRNSEKKTRNRLSYELTGHEINIYQSPKSIVSSLLVSKTTKAFDVSLDGKTMISGDEDGIHQWSLTPLSKKHTTAIMKKIQDYSRLNSE